MKNPYVAIVDDDASFANYLRTFLSLRGYEARCCTRGDDPPDSMQHTDTPAVTLPAGMRPGLDGRAPLRAPRLDRRCRGSTGVLPTPSLPRCSLTSATAGAMPQRPFRPAPSPASAQHRRRRRSERRPLVVCHSGARAATAASEPGIWRWDEHFELPGSLGLFPRAPGSHRGSEHILRKAFCLRSPDD